MVRLVPIQENTVFPRKMIKVGAKFIIGFVLGSLALFALVYTAGFVLNAVGIMLFDSEDDQQRNFNIIVILWLVVALPSGWFATRRGR